MAATVSGIHLGPDDHASRPSSGMPVGAFYYCTDHDLLYIWDGATWTTYLDNTAGGGDVATDAIWDAAGDLAVGSGSNTAAKLSIGATNGMALRRVSGAVAWAFPPGHELAYVEFTSPVTVTGTSEATGTTIVSAGSVAFDGSTRVCIEFFAPFCFNDGADRGLVFDLSDGGSEIGRMGNAFGDAGGDTRMPILLRRFLTPSAASHTYDIQAWKTNTATMTVDAGAGGTGAAMPGYIRITVA